MLRYVDETLHVGDIGYVAGWLPLRHYSAAAIAVAIRQAAAILPLPRGYEGHTPPLFRWTIRRLLSYAGCLAASG